MYHYNTYKNENTGVGIGNRFEEKITSSPRSKKVKTNGKDSVYTAGEYDQLKYYFRDVGNEPLLTKKQEAKLSAKMRQLENSIFRIDRILSQKEQMGLRSEPYRAFGMRTYIKYRKVLQKTYDIAKNKFIKSNLKLVIRFAAGYSGKGLPLSDLIQEGNIGLIKAVEKFDHRKGFRFSTYATWWINQALTRAFYEQTRKIKVPIRVIEQANIIYRLTSNEANGEVSNTEVDKLAGTTGWSQKVINNAISVTNMQFVYFDAPATENNKPLGETFANNLPETDEHLIRISLSTTINQALTTLTHRERDILKMRYGIDEGEVYTLDQIGNMYDLTRERIRQIERRALKKIRRKDRDLSLQDYLQV